MYHYFSRSGSQSSVSSSGMLTAIDKLPNAFLLEPQKLDNGRCEHFEKSRDVNEGEFSKQRRSEKSSDYSGQLFQGDGSTDISSRPKYFENHRSSMWVRTEKKTSECDTRENAFSSRFSCQCNNSWKTFANEDELKKHARTHLEGYNERKPYRCSKCEKSYSQSCALRKHVKMAHSTEKRSPFQYNKFTRKQHFENRMRIPHSEEGPFIDVTWIKSSDCPSALKRHEGTDRCAPVNLPSISNGIGLDQRKQKLDSDQTLFQRNAEFSLQKKLDEQICDDLVQRFRRHKV